MGLGLSKDIAVAWRPFPGSQTRYLTCPHFEVLYEGTRGPGKTETLLVDFLQHVGQGFGAAWRGIIFRKEYKHLDDVVTKSKRLFKRIFPEARFLGSKSDYKWVFPTGEELLFRTFKNPDDYWNYHGHEYPFIGWEELTNWPNDLCYLSMFSCCRSAVPNMPRKYRSTCNPWGAGHSWVKSRFIDPAPAEKAITNEFGLKRVRIHGHVYENLALLKAQPEYIQQLESIENENLKRAWLHGDWDIVVGGFLQGLWDRDKHVVKPFRPPLSWPRWRAMDWGFAKPYSVGWYCIDPDGKTYRYREMYGYGGKADTGSRQTATEVAREIVKAEAKERKAGCKFKRNPADSNIWHNIGEEKTIAELFKQKKVIWVPAKKGPGSRVNGAQVVIQTLRDESFAVTEDCLHFLRTVPILEPDEHNWEDVDTTQEDHAWDEWRYSTVSRHKGKRDGPKQSGPKHGTFEHLIQNVGKKPLPLQKSTYTIS